MNINLFRNLGYNIFQSNTPQKTVKSKHFSLRSVIWLGVFAFLIIVLLLFTTKNSEAATITVDDDGPADYSNIGDAIDAANDGDTVYVYNGTYYENLWVSKTINLTGENKITTIIDGDGNGDTINVNTNYVNITGFNITKGYSYAGLELNNVKFCRIYNNRFFLNNHAIYIYSSFNNNITNNDILNNLGGIEVYLSSNNIITNNNISNNREFGGVSLRKSSNNMLINNNFTRDGVSISGDQLYHYTSHTIPDNNIVNNKPLYYYVSRHWMDIDGIHVGELILVNCSNISVRNLEIINTLGGVDISYSDNIIITGNKIWNNSWGISMKLSSYCNLTNNDVFGGITGIYLKKSNNNFISSNSIQSAWHKGIFLSNSNYINIIDNIVIDSDFGIWLWDASFNDISRNNISSIKFEGIYLREACKQNRITENTLINCNKLSFTYYIRLVASTGDIPPSENIIYHNNFIDNDAVGELGFDDGTNNIWDYGGEGNYWSDYTGSDDDGDGIGDTPYEIDSNTYDNYPLMQPYTGSIPPDTKPPFFISSPYIIHGFLLLPRDNFYLEFTTNEQGHYEVIIDTDGVQGFDNTTDMILKGNTTAEFQFITWDGKNSNSNFVKDGDYQIRVIIWDLAGNQIAKPCDIGFITIILDSDEDGIRDVEDAFPNDPTQWDDRDGDGWGDNTRGNNPDAFPDDPNEWLDTDNDKIGNNADLDDDNDGIPDQWEEKYGLNSTNHQDAKEDKDDDGYTNLQEYKAGTNPLDANSKPFSLVDYFYYILFAVIVIPMLITTLVMKKLYTKHPKTVKAEEESIIDEGHIVEDKEIEKEDHIEDASEEDIPPKEETPTDAPIIQKIRDHPPTISDTKIFCSNCRYPIILHEGDFLPIECPMCKTMVQPPRKLN